jgi:hypothetical protein
MTEIEILVAQFYKRILLWTFNSVTESVVYEKASVKVKFHWFRINFLAVSSDRRTGACVMYLTLDNMTHYAASESPPTHTDCWLNSLQ